MHEKEFNELVLNRFRTCKEILTVKAGEYAIDEDRLHNFRVAAAMLQVTPEQALVGMWAKHLVSILDMVHLVSEHGIVPSGALVSEKITDAINYLVLLESLFEERRRESGNHTEQDV